MVRCANSPVRQIIGLVLVVTVTSLAGCSKENPYQRVAVHGRIVLDGNELEKGTIVFVPQTGVVGPQVAGTIVDGRYQISTAQGPVCGGHKVQIFADLKLPYNLEDAEAHAAHVAAGGSAEVRQAVARHYNLNTQLTAETTADGPNEFNFSVRHVGRGR